MRKEKCNSTAPLSATTIVGDERQSQYPRETLDAKTTVARDTRCSHLPTQKRTVGKVNTLENNSSLEDPPPAQLCLVHPIIFPSEISVRHRGLQRCQPFHHGNAAAFPLIPSGPKLFPPPPSAFPSVHLPFVIVPALYSHHVISLRQKPPKDSPGPCTGRSGVYLTNGCPFRETPCKSTSSSVT